MTTDIWTQLNNAVLDLQASDLGHYERPLSDVGRILTSPELQEINAALTAGLDVDAFLEASRNTQGGMVGSARLQWPEDPLEYLGMRLLLILKLAENPRGVTGIVHTFYHSASRKIIAEIHGMASQLIIPFARDYRQYVQSVQRPQSQRPLATGAKNNRIFVVHGHDGEARESVARFLEKTGFEAVILHEQANRGKTVIEKVEANSDVSFAVVILSPDDEGRKVGDSDLEPRARQNVLLELGYFIGLLGRENVCALRRGTVEIPSDFAGVVWEQMDASNGWKQALARELEASGHDIDWNIIMGKGKGGKASTAKK